MSKKSNTNGSVKKDWITEEKKEKKKPTVVTVDFRKNAVKY